MSVFICTGCGGCVVHDHVKPPLCRACVQNAIRCEALLRRDIFAMGGHVRVNGRRVTLVMPAHVKEMTWTAPPRCWTVDIDMEPSAPGMVCQKIVPKQLLGGDTFEVSRKRIES